MFTRPFLPFRVRPVREVEVRRSPLQTADLLEVLDGMAPVAVRAERRPVKASRVLAGQGSRRGRAAGRRPH